MQRLALRTKSQARRLQATALVHEAYVRLVDQTTPQQWDGRGHFFAAAAEAMRRILVERARKKKRLKEVATVFAPICWSTTWPSTLPPTRCSPSMTLWSGLARRIRWRPSVLKLKYYAGLSVDDAADGIGRVACNRLSSLDLCTGVGTGGIAGREIRRKPARVVRRKSDKRRIA